MDFALIWMGVVVVAVVIGFILTRRSRDNAWRQLAAELGADFIPGRVFGASKVQLQAPRGTITLDSYSVPSGDSSTTYTRIRAGLPNKDGFQFMLRREGLVARIDKKLGLKDIEIGVPDFDHDFVIQSNDESRVRSLLADARVRELIQGQRSIRLGIVKGDLYFEAQGVIKDVPRLKSLFDLFQRLLNALAA